MREACTDELTTEAATEACTEVDMEPVLIAVVKMVRYLGQGPAVRGREPKVDQLRLAVSALTTCVEECCIVSNKDECHVRCSDGGVKMGLGMQQNRPKKSCRVIGAGQNRNTKTMHLTMEVRHKGNGLDFRLGSGPKYGTFL